MSIKKILLFLVSLAVNGHIIARQKRITIMLNPAGDAQYAGRTIEGTFERGVTLQCCEYLKKAIEAEHSGVRVILTRIPGETLDPLQNASFANRLGADLYISIHFFEKKQGQPQLYLYYFCLNSVTDSWNFASRDLSFVPYNKAYLEQLQVTKQIAQAMATRLQKEYSHSFETHKPLGVPFFPLIGVKAPAIGIEASLKNSQDWRLFAASLVDSIGIAIEIGPKKRGSRNA